MSEFASDQDRIENELRNRIADNVKLKAYKKAANFQLLYEVAVEESVKMILELEKKN